MNYYQYRGRCDDFEGDWVIYIRSHAKLITYTTFKRNVSSQSFYGLLASMGFRTPNAPKAIDSRGKVYTIGQGDPLLQHSPGVAFFKSVTPTKTIYFFTASGYEYFFYAY